MDVERTWAERLGLALDRVLNVLLFDGDDTETVSLHAAHARQNGEEWGCILCEVLSFLVELDHCDKTLDPTQQESAGAALRAGFVICLTFALLASVALLVFRLL